jgi:hypothetical protein
MRLYLHANEVVAGEREIASHGTWELPVWSRRFGPGGSAAPGVAAAYARRNLEMLAAHLESVQRTD